MIFEADRAPAIYARLQHAFVPQLRSLAPEQSALAVAACPGWTLKDVMAHVSGLVAETLAGVPLPRGSDEATARQVADRAGLSLNEVLDEWLANAEAFAKFGQQDPTYVAALTSDLVVHALDISETLGGAITVDAEAVGLVAARYGHALLDRARDAGLALMLILDGEPLAEADHNDPVILRASSLDFLCGVTARRTRQEVLAMDWTGTPESLLATAWSQYGPLGD